MPQEGNLDKHATLKGKKNGRGKTMKQSANGIQSTGVGREKKPHMSRTILDRIVVGRGGGGGFVFGGGGGFGPPSKGKNRNIPLVPRGKKEAGRNGTEPGKSHFLSPFCVSRVPKKRGILRFKFGAGDKGGVHLIISTLGGEGKT